MHKQIMRPHFVVSACCPVLSTAACLKGHSCEKCLSNYVPDFDLKMQTYLSIKEAVAFIVTASYGIWYDC